VLHVRWSVQNHHHQGQALLPQVRSRFRSRAIWNLATNQKGGIMIENRLAKKGIYLSAKGRRWADNFEGAVVALAIVAVFGIVGSIETGRWF